MSMTREEASVLLKMMFAFWANTHERTNVEMEMALNLALSALRPFSREQVEKVWRGEWRLFDDCANEGLYCSQCGKKVYRVEYANVKMATRFCPNCMSAMTDEAVDMVMERLETLHESP